MNERIQELAQQAGIHPVNFEPDADLAVPLTAFAELIVKECIRVPYAMWDRAELNADVAVKIEHRIRDHFGMEQ